MSRQLFVHLYPSSICVQLTSLNTLSVACIQRVEIVGVSTTSPIDKALTGLGFLVVEIILEICQTVALFFLHVANICGIKITISHLTQLYSKMWKFIQVGIVKG